MYVNMIKSNQNLTVPKYVLLMIAEPRNFFSEGTTLTTKSGVWLEFSITK